MPSGEPATPTPSRRRVPDLRLPDLSGRQWLTLILLGAFLWSALQVDWSGGLVHRRGFQVLGELAGGLATPNLSGDVLNAALSAAWSTTAFAVAGLSLALVMGIPLGIIASGALSGDGGIRRVTVVVARTVLSALRSVHELVWAWLFVASIGLSPFAAVFALAIPYAGILGRIYADLLVDVDERPLRALRGSGATERTVLLYGRLPAMLPEATSYTFYRLECGLRSSAILGFVGLGGLGLQIQLALNDLDYSRASTLLIVLIGLIVIVEVWSTLVRRRIGR